MATDPRDIQLTDEQRKLLAAKADETGKPVSEIVDALLTPKPRRVPREGYSFLDAMRKHGLVGSMEGPGDLSTNPKHMEGFGESRGGKNSD